MTWQECDERAHIEDSLRNGDFMLDEIHGIEPGFHGVDEECDHAQHGSCPTSAKCDEYGCNGACVRDAMPDFFEALFLVASDACDHYDIDHARVPAWYLLIDDRGYWIQVPVRRGVPA